MGKRRRSSRHHSTDRLRIWQLVSVGLVAVGVVVLVGFALRPATPPTTSSSRPAYTAPAETPAAAPKVAAFIGDSYTAGAGGTAGGFAQLVGQTMGWTVENLGRGGTGFIVNTQQNPADAQIACGQDYCESYAEMIPAAVAAGAEVVVVSGGRNNYRTDPEQLQVAIDQFYTDLRAALPNAQIITTSPLWDDDPQPESLGAISAMMQAATLAVGGTYVDLGQPLSGQPDLLTADSVHPNDVGYRAIADVILAGLAS